MMDIFMRIWQIITDVMVSSGTSVVSSLGRSVKTKWQWLLAT